MTLATFHRPGTMHIFFCNHGERECRWEMTDGSALCREPNPCSVCGRPGPWINDRPGQMTLMPLAALEAQER